jgi:hypothetical protein
MDVQDLQYVVHRSGYKGKESPSNVGIAPTRILQCPGCPTFVESLHRQCRRSMRATLHFGIHRIGVAHGYQ